MMSLSWNFPALAEPSYESFEPSWGTLIFELTELTIPTIKNHEFHLTHFFPKVFVIRSLGS